MSAKELVAGQWGKSTAVRLPKSFVERKAISAGDVLEYEETEDAVILRPKPKGASREDALAAVEEMKEIRKRMRLDGLSIAELLAEGRRGE
jgi:antitoxin MazE